MVVVVSFLSSLFSHYVLYHQSPTHSIFCCCSPFSSHFIHNSLNTVPPRIIRLPSSPPFPSIVWVCILFANSVYMSVTFTPTLHQFLLKTVFLFLSLILTYLNVCISQKQTTTNPDYIHIHSIVCHSLQYHSHSLYSLPLSPVSFISTL